MSLTYTRLGNVVQVVTDDREHEVVRVFEALQAGGQDAAALWWRDQTVVQLAGGAHYDAPDTTTADDLTALLDAYVEAT